MSKASTMIETLIAHLNTAPDRINNPLPANYFRVPDTGVESIVDRIVQFRISDDGTPGKLTGYFNENGDLTELIYQNVRPVSAFSNGKLKSLGPPIPSTIEASSMIETFIAHLNTAPDLINNPLPADYFRIPATGIDTVMIDDDEMILTINPQTNDDSPGDEQLVGFFTDGKLTDLVYRVDTQRAFALRNGELQTIA